MPDLNALLAKAGSLPTVGSAAQPVAPVVTQPTIVPPPASDPVPSVTSPESKPEQTDPNALTEVEAAVLRKFGIDPSTIGKKQEAPARGNPKTKSRFHVELKGQPPAEVEAFDRLDAMAVYNTMMGVRSTDKPYSIWEIE